MVNRDHANVIFVTRRFMPTRFGEALTVFGDESPGVD